MPRVHTISGTSCDEQFRSCLKRSSRKACLRRLAKCSRKRGERTRRPPGVRLGRILDDTDQPTTPKRLAQELLMDGVAVTRGYWGEKIGDRYDRMTKRERDAVTGQLEKQGDRIAHMFGYDGSWSA